MSDENTNPVWTTQTSQNDQTVTNQSENDFVLDVCAAPGGKTIQASMKLNNTGLVISNDLSRSRSSITVSNLERLGLGNVIVSNNDFEKIYERYLEKFDVVITNNIYRSGGSGPEL